MEYSNSGDGYIQNHHGYKGTVSSGGGSSLILDNERGEIVRAVANNCKPVVDKASVNSEKAMLALRNHSQAERRRRERINGHLAALRNIIPGTTKVSSLFFVSIYI